MTTKEVLQHPNTDKITHITTGAVLGLLLQHGIDIKYQVATLSQFFSSDQFHAAALAVIAIFTAVKNGLKPEQPKIYAVPQEDIQRLTTDTLRNTIITPQLATQPPANVAATALKA